MEHQTTLHRIREQAEPAFADWLATQSKQARPNTAPSGAIAHFPLDTITDGKLTNATERKYDAAVVGDGISESKHVSAGQIVNAFQTGAEIVRAYHRSCRL